MIRYCLALDLQNDPALIAEYIEHHRRVWPEVLASLREAGVQDMQIYRRDDRLFMIMDVEDTFSFERKAELERTAPNVQAWESLMGRYQKKLRSAAPGEKWVLMDCIFELKSATSGEASHQSASCGTLRSEPGYLS